MPPNPELESRQALKLHLRGLYPHLKKRDLKIKLAAAADAGLYGFFRSYVPYFYDLLRRTRSDPTYPDFHGMEVIEGWCVGDAHPENIGTIYCQSQGNKNNMVFTMNDPDDGGPGPLLADLLRFLTAVRLSKPGMFPLQCPHEDNPDSMACSDAPELVMNRVGETLDLERGLNISRFCNVVRFKNLPPMVVRPRWKGNRCIEFNSGN